MSTSTRREKFLGIGFVVLLALTVFLLWPSNDCVGLCVQKTQVPGLRTTKVSKRQVFVVNYNTAFTFNSSDEFSKKLDTIYRYGNEGDVLLLNINSPGGAVVSCSHDSDEVLSLKRRGIKVIAQVDYLAASCGYELASTADIINASSGAIVGNIGTVFIRHATVKEGLLHLSKTQPTTFVGSSRIKELMAGAPIKTAADIAFFKSKALRGLIEFKNKVIRLRGNRLAKDKYDIIFSGDSFSGAEGLSLGLVDNNKTLRETLFTLTLDGSKLFTIKYVKKPTLLERLLK